MKPNVKPLDEKALLEKNPAAEAVFKSNRKKLGGRHPRAHEYDLGLPYGRPSLISANETTENEFELPA